MKCAISLLVTLLIFISPAYAQLRIFSPDENIRAADFNHNFNYIKNQLQANGLSINFSSYFPGQIITPEIVNQNIEEIKLLGISVSTLSSGRIRSSDINQIFQEMLLGITYPNAPDGNLYIAAGQTRTLAAGSKKEYGSIVIEPTGVLEIISSGSGDITEIIAQGPAIINGTIVAQSGEHAGGTFNYTAKSGEALSYSITQKNGGNGASAQGSVINEPTTGWYQNKTQYSVRRSRTNQIFIWNGVNVSGTVSDGLSSYTVGNTIYYRGSEFTEDSTYSWHLIRRVINATGGLAGSAGFGNGGGGGRSSNFTAANGGAASSSSAGLGAGQGSAASTYGSAGANSTTSANAGGGGFRGSHGLGIYLKALQIKGTGTINASGKDGGNGGAGGLYSSFANGAGGVGAGGSGGRVWLRYKGAAPTLNLVTAGGLGGAKGARASVNAGDAGDGEAGNAGSTSILSY